HLGVGDDGARRPHSLDRVPHPPFDVLRQSAGIACPTNEIAEPCRDLGRIRTLERLERRRELARGNLAPQWLARKSALEYFEEPGRKLGGPPTERRDVRLANRQEHGKLARSRENTLADQELSEHCTEREQIRSVIEGV